MMVRGEGLEAGPWVELRARRRSLGGGLGGKVEEPEAELGGGAGGGAKRWDLRRGWGSAPGVGRGRWRSEEEVRGRAWEKKRGIHWEEGSTRK